MAGAFWERGWTDGGVDCRSDRWFFLSGPAESSRPASPVRGFSFPGLVQSEFGILHVVLFAWGGTVHSSGCGVVRIRGGARASVG